MVAERRCHWSNRLTYRSMVPKPCLGCSIHPEGTTPRSTPTSCWSMMRQKGASEHAVSPMTRWAGRADASGLHPSSAAR
jgi:hypothetical protein